MSNELTITWDTPDGMTWQFEPSPGGGRFVLRQDEVVGGVTVRTTPPSPSYVPRTTFTDGITWWVNGRASNRPEFSPPPGRFTSIVVLSGDNLDYLKPCLLSVQEHQTEEEPFEVVLVTNAKHRETLDGMKASRWSFDFRIVHCAERFSFARYNNLGVREARGTYLLFLNDDTKVTTDWLKEMLVILEADPSVGIVGARLVGFDERLQHCGIAIKQPGEHYAQHPLQGQAKDSPSAMVDRVTDAVTGACLCIRRSVFESVGGFDESFERGYYEDTDLCLRVKVAGHRTIYAHKSVVYHKGSASFERERDMHGIFLANTVKFKERWDATIENNAHSFNSPRYRYRPKTMLLQDGFLSTAGGGERTLATLARYYANCYQTMIRTQDATNGVKHMIADRLKLDLYAVPLINEPPLMSPHVFMNGEWASDTVGMGTERNLYWVMFPHMIGHGRAADWLNTYDTLIANSAFTQQAVHDRWHRDSLVIYPPVRLFGGSVQKTQSIIAIGRFFPAEHSKKQDLLVETFVNSSLPRQGWSLHLCGSVKPENAHHLRYMDAVKTKAGKELNQSVIFHVNCSFTELAEIAQQATVFWHATGHGESDPGAWEHFGIATVEAMSAGCWPIVFGRGGQMEIVTDGAGDTWETPEEMVAKTETFWQLREANRRLLQQSAMHRAEDFSESHFFERLQELDL